MKNLINVSERNEFAWTTNRNLYNKLKKHYHESVGDIYCSYCPYNGGENSRKKWYGGHQQYKNGIARYADGIEGELCWKITHPSWKLATKNKKQWMKKPKNYQIIHKTSKYTGRKYIDIKF